MTWYTITAKDDEDYTVGFPNEDWESNKKSAIQVAKDMLAEPELVASGMTRVEVTNSDGEIVWDAEL